MPKVRWNVSKGDWGRIVAECPQATFFHLPGWYQTMAECFGYRPAAVHIELESGAALLPLATHRTHKGLLKQACSGIEGGYGAWVSPTNLNSGYVAIANTLVRKRYPELRITGNPFQEAQRPADGAGQESIETTQVVRLLPRDEQLKAMSNSRVKAYRRGVEEFHDLVIHEGLREADVKLFYPTYAEHAAEWKDQRWVRNEAYFKALVRHCGDNLVLFLAYHDGFLSGFRLIGRNGAIGTALHVARSSRYADWDVGPFLAVESMAWCFERGMTHLDLMGSGQLESIKSYKASFGAQTMPYVNRLYVGPVGESLEALRRLVRPQQNIAVS